MHRLPFSLQSRVQNYFLRGAGLALTVFTLDSDHSMRAGWEAKQISAERSVSAAISLLPSPAIIHCELDQDNSLTFQQSSSLLFIFRFYNFYLNEAKVEREKKEMEQTKVLES